MEFFISAMLLILAFFRQDFTLYCFTFSFWDVILLSAISGIVVMFLKKFFE